MNKVQRQAENEAEDEAENEADETETSEQTETELSDPPLTTSGRLAGLLAITGMIVPVVALTGALDLTGNIGRVQRNDPILIVAGLSIVTLAAGLWVASGFVMERWRPTKAALAADPGAVSVKGRKRRLWLKVGAVTATVVGVTLVLLGTVRSSMDRPAPKITPKISANARHVKAHISASQLATHEFVGFSIVGLRKTGARGAKSKLLYSGFVGPDLEGKVNQVISTYLPANTYKSVLIQAYSSDEGLECREFAENSQAALDRRFGHPMGDNAEATGAKEGRGTACLWIPLVASPTRKRS